MGYSHYFYAVDLERVQAIYNSKDMKTVAKLAKAKPQLKPMLKAIVNGKVDKAIEPGAYGYTLMAICETMGEQVGGEVADVRDHPYDSQLTCSGPPIPIPYDETNFPQIGYLEAAEIENELALTDPSKKQVKKRKIPGKRRGTAAQMEAAIADDVAGYREALEEAQQLGLAIVSFRH